MNKFAVMFRWAVIAGIIQDWFFALPGIFIPSAILQFAGAEPVTPPTWPAYACLLLMLLSFFYIPAAIDPFRYSSFALFTVIARFGGVIFFFFLYPGAFPPLFGYIDLTLTLLQGSLLVLALIAAGPKVPEITPAGEVR
ncbi:MAG TPA: hypothetical protein VH592_04820 [Gemmataceae bacterium]|jgi:hypothetical protein